jgi:hypothetical protein
MQAELDDQEKLYIQEVENFLVIEKQTIEGAKATIKYYEDEIELNKRKITACLRQIDIVEAKVAYTKAAFENWKKDKGL